MRNVSVRLVGVMVVIALGITFLSALTALVADGILRDVARDLPQAHRAVYDLSLDSADASSMITALEGRMVVEWRGGPSCDGYTSEQRVVTKSIDDAGQASLSDVRLSAWEAADGNEFRFDRTEYLDGTLSGSENGIARRDHGIVVLALEGAEPVVLPSGVMFPNAFNMALTSAIQRGKTSFARLLFDGAQPSATNVTAFVGKAEPLPADIRKLSIGNAGEGIALADMTVRPVHMSYFDMNPDATSDTVDMGPSFEMGFLVSPNGVMSGLRLIYEDAIIKGTLIDVEYFKRGSC
ncbi:MAG: DUF1849 family protein [Parvibaculum sp.]|nr:DUF1849 family protein [Parvibaculum sp.]|tara:strand:- start:5362 stop:6243 length:882 start_codon:yes stop_codon:yes gene_type:complete